MSINLNTVEEQDLVILRELFKDQSPDDIALRTGLSLKEVNAILEML